MARAGFVLWQEECEPRHLSSLPTLSNFCARSAHRHVIENPMRGDCVLEDLDTCHVLGLKVGPLFHNGILSLRV